MVLAGPTHASVIVAKTPSTDIVTKECLHGALSDQVVPTFLCLIRSKSAAERVEIAVKRFRKNRRFTPERAAIFSSYLDYGGIKTGQNAFQGGGGGAPGGADEGEVDLEAMTATVDVVDLPEDGQVVDFTNVVTTFLSQHFLRNTGWVDMLYYKDTPLVVAALLNYFLVRNVVPEYEEDVRSALAVAEQARMELPLCKLISNGLPGRFSKACSLVYGGSWHRFLESTWQEQSLTETLGMDLPTAEKIIQSIIGFDVDLKSLELAPRVFMDLEIIDVELPNDDTTADSPEGDDPPNEDEAELVEMVDRMLLGAGQEQRSDAEGSSSPVNKPEAGGSAPESKFIQWPMLAKVTLAELDPSRTREEQAPVEQRRQVYTYFDLSIATKMLRGMRIEAFVYTLSNGMSYLEQASVYPTFYLEVDVVEEDAVADWGDD